VSPILEISDLSVAYRTPGGDVRAVEQVSLTLNAGEVVGLCGESGSGKSTLAYGATRLLRPPALITSGSVRYGGRRITSGGDPVDLLTMSHRELRRTRWREIAIVFQSAMNALNPVLRVQDQLLDAVQAHLRLSRGEAKDKAATLLDLVGIPRNRLRAYPHELSGGMRQRVMIAMALAADPEVVLMDEPTTALDVVVQRDILAQIVELKETLGFSVLFITHDLSLLLELADRIAVMYAGRLLETGTADAIMREPAHPYTPRCAARAGSWPASPARRPTCVTPSRAARSSRAARMPSRRAHRWTCHCCRSAAGRNRPATDPMPGLSSAT
jgi:ABC-type glutathione transport system ATPase component